MPSLDLATYESEAYVALLDRIAVTLDDDAERHADITGRIGELRNWFLQHPQWNLLDSAGATRLAKAPAIPAESFGLHEVRDSSGRDRPIREPLDYEMLCWVLWYAEEAQDGQFLLSWLTERIESAAIEIGTDRINWDLREQRMSLSRALNLLIALGVLVERDSEELDWVASRQGEALFEFTDLARLMQPYLPAGLTEMKDPRAALDSLGASLVQDVDPETRAYRHLLLSTAFHRHTDPEAFEVIFNETTGKEIEQNLREAFGWTVEITGHYAALVRSEESPRTARNRFPLNRTACDIGLLLCAVIQDEVSPGRRDRFERVRLSGTEVLNMLTDLSDQWARYWGELGTRGPSSLAAEVLPILREANLVEGPNADGYITFLPLAARFRGEYVRLESTDGHQD